MLQAIYNRTQGWIAWTIIIIVAATFIIWEIENYQRNRGSDAIKAEVNGTSISEQQFRTTYERLRRQRQSEMGANFTLTPAVEQELKQYALQQLILEEVLSQAAKQSGFIITSAQAESALLRIPAFQQDGHFSQERFYQLLTSALFTPKTFVAQLQIGMLINQARAGVVASEFTLPNEVNQVIKLTQQQRAIQYLVIPGTQFANKINKPSSDALLNYYKQHQQEFMAPEKVRIEYIELSQQDLQKQMSIQPSEVEEYYERNQGNYKSPAKWQVAHILILVPANASEKEEIKAKEKLAVVEKELKNNVNFAQVARKYSEDYLSASQGGMLPWVLPGTLEPALEKSISRLQVGQYSSVVKTKNGYEIIKLVAMQKPKQLTLDEVKSEIEKNIKAEKLQQSFATAIDELTNIAYANPDSLVPVAKALNLPIQVSDFITRKGGKDRISANTKILSAVFSEDVLDNGNNSDVIQFDTNAAIVLRVKERLPAKVIPFSSVKNQINDKLTTQAMKLKAQEVGQEILAQLKQGKGVQALLDKYSLQWKMKKDLTQESQVISPSLVQSAFSLSYSPRQKSTSVAGLPLYTGDYVIVQLLGVKEGELSKVSNEQRRVLRDQIESTEGLLAYEFYVQALMHKAKIEVTESSSTKPV